MILKLSLIIVIAVLIPKDAECVHPMDLMAKARVQGLVDRGKLAMEAHNNLHRIRAAQPPQYPMQHTAVLPSFSVSYPTTPHLDPRFLHVHHHHIHHGGGLHHSGLIHKPLHLIHRKPGHVHFAQTIVNNVHTRQAHRAKRELPIIAAVKLAANPDVRIDLIRTIDNVKEATKDICEKECSPLYHLRDAVGSARDIFFSVLRMSPTGLLVPTTYEVTDIRAKDTVGDINAALLDGAKVDAFDNALPTNTAVERDEVHDTSKALQTMLRNSFRGARDSAQHVGDTVHSIRRAILSVPRSSLRLLFPYVKALELRKGGLLGSPSHQGAPTETPKLVGAGKLLELVRRAALSDTSEEQVVMARKSPIKSSKANELLNKARNDFKNNYNNYIQ